MNLDKLNDLEKVKIETFCADEAMYNAVKKALLNTIYGEGVIDGDNVSVKNSAFNFIANAYQAGETVTNEALGERLRALYEGVHELENGFSMLKKVKTAKESPYVEENEGI